MSGNTLFHFCQLWAVNNINKGVIWSRHLVNAIYKNWGVELLLCLWTNNWEIDIVIFLSLSWKQRFSKQYLTLYTKSLIKSEYCSHFKNSHPDSSSLLHSAAVATASWKYLWGYSTMKLWHWKSHWKSRVTLKNLGTKEMSNAEKFSVWFKIFQCDFIVLEQQRKIFQWDNPGLSLWFPS